MIFSASIPPSTTGRKGAVVVVAGAFGAKLAFWGLFLAESRFCKCGFACYNCYKLLFVSIKVRIGKCFRLLQASGKPVILLQIVTILLQVVTKVCYKVVTVLKYWYSVSYNGCYKCNNCNRKKLAHTKNKNS